ncbi:MAG: AAA family ATPase [Solirubrobacterales bacterium]
MSAMRPTVAEYLAAHAIDPAVAEREGVSFEGEALVFPSGRRRDLNGGSAKTTQPVGQPLALAWFGGTNSQASDALITEGESDALAASSALPSSPLPHHRDLSVAAIPGCGFPVDRLVASLKERGITEAYLAFDGDEAGRAYAEKVAVALRENGICVALVDLPDGKDLSDCLVAERERREWLASLLADAHAAAEPLATAGDDGDEDDPGIRWAARKPLPLHTGKEPEPPDLLADGLERGTVVALCGDTGSAKSFIAQALAVAVAESHERWLGKGLSIRYGHAIYIDEENPVRIARARFRALGLTPQGEPYLRCFHRLGVRFGEDDWTDWLRWELGKQGADVVVIDTGIAATAPEVNDNDAVARLYTEHLRPLAADTGAVVVLLLHEKKPQEGGRLKQTFATMGARAWVGQADAQLMLAKRGRTEEEQLDGGYRLESRFALATGKLRDGGSEVIEVIRIASRLRDDRALLEATITNEGEVASADEKAAEMLDAICEVLVTEAEPLRKAALAEAVGVKGGDRTFERALTDGVEHGQLERPKRGTYALGGGR